MPGHQFAHDSEADRYTLRIGEELVAVLDYAQRGDAVSLHRTFTAPRHRGNGYAGDLVTYAVDHIERHSEHRIVPMCWYVSEWFERHPERVGLLHR